MKNTIEILSYPKAKMGWNHCHKVLDHLFRGDYKIDFLYLSESHELVILDEKLIEILDFLQVPYDLKKPSNAIKYIKEG